MAITESYEQLAQEQIASGGADDIYTVPANTQTIIKHISIVNPSGSDCWVKLWTGGTGNANLILPQVSVDAGGWAEFGQDSITLHTGVTLYAEAETNDALTITVNGAELVTS